MNFREFIPKWETPNFGNLSQLKRMVEKNPDNLLAPHALTNLSDWLQIQRSAETPTWGQLIDLSQLDAQGVRQLALAPVTPREFGGWGPVAGEAVVRRVARLNPSPDPTTQHAAGLFNAEKRDLKFHPDYADFRDPNVFFHEYGHGLDNIGVFSEQDRDGLLAALDHLRNKPSSSLRPSVRNVLSHIDSPYYRDLGTSPYLQSLEDTSPEALREIVREEAVAEMVAQQKEHELWSSQSNAFRDRMPFSEYLPSYPTQQEWF